MTGARLLASGCLVFGLGAWTAREMLVRTILRRSDPKRRSPLIVGGKFLYVIPSGEYLEMRIATIEQDCRNFNNAGPADGVGLEAAAAA